MDLSSAPAFAGHGFEAVWVAPRLLCVPAGLELEEHVLVDSNALRQISGKHRVMTRLMRGGFPRKVVVCCCRQLANRYEEACSHHVLTINSDWWQYITTAVSGRNHVILSKWLWEPVEWWLISIQLQPRQAFLDKHVPLGRCFLAWCSCHVYPVHGQEGFPWEWDEQRSSVWVEGNDAWLERESLKSGKGIGWLGDVIHTHTST